MTPELVTELFLNALKIGLLLAGPVLLFGLAAGLIVSIFQAATQIQEMTLIFIPKILAVILAIVIFFPWMLEMVVGFTHDLIANIPLYIR